MSTGIDDGDEAIATYEREDDEDDDDIQYRELDMDRLAMEASEIDSTGITVAVEDRLKDNNVPVMNGESSCKYIIIMIDIYVLTAMQSSIS